MRILITGAFGQLGFALNDVLSDKFDVIRTGRVIPSGLKGIGLNIQDKIYLNEVIAATSPDLIINLAAMTNVDACEKNPEVAKEVNIAGFQHICDSFKGKIIQLSTDYVFDGKNGPYKEDDPVCPISVYGKTKLASEKLIFEHSSDNLVIRGNVLYDDSLYTKASFLNWVVESLRNNQNIKVVNDQFNNPTWTRSMADIIELCIYKNVNGIIHWGDSDHVSRYDFAVMIAEKYSLKSSLIQPISTEELAQEADRPLQSGLITEKISKMLNVIPPSIDDCLSVIIEKNNQ